MMKHVKIINTNGVGFGTKIIDAATNIEIQGASSIDISIKANDVVRAVVELGAVEIEVVGAVAEYVVAHPRTGSLKPVKKIEYADGEVVEF